MFGREPNNCFHFVEEVEAIFQSAEQDALTDNDIARIEEINNIIAEADICDAGKKSYLIKLGEAYIATKNSENRKTYSQLIEHFCSLVDPALDLEPLKQKFYMEAHHPINRIEPR